MDTDVAEYFIKINGERIYIEVIHGNRFRYADTSEQCHDCGGDEFRLNLNRSGHPEALICEKCETAYPLIKV